MGLLTLRGTELQACYGTVAGWAASVAGVKNWRRRGFCDEGSERGCGEEKLGGRDWKRRGGEERRGYLGTYLRGELMDGDLMRDGWYGPLLLLEEQDRAYANACIDISEPTMRFRHPAPIYCLFVRPIYVLEESMTTL
jgi:hypothetical protein